MSRLKEITDVLLKAEQEYQDSFISQVGLARAIKDAICDLTKYLFGMIER